MRLPTHQEVINIPVIGCKREDDICSFWERDMCDQGSGPGLDGFAEWHHVVLSRPADDVMHRSVETEELLQSD